MSNSAVDRLLSEIRAGSKPALDQLVDLYRPRLLRFAKRRIPAALAGKLSPSDAVQNTSLDALQSVAKLRANSERECTAWFLALLINNIEDASRQFIDSQMREVKRERPLSTDDSRNLVGTISSSIQSPLEHLLGREDNQQFESALNRLAVEYRTIIEQRSRDGLSFKEIGVRQNKSPDAVRMIWKRAVKQLTQDLRDATSE
jgi:RNA polymerase sigma-70 factor (subfamily 1)